ncbi:hypothetical protein [Pseudonocardia sp. T1-2H]|uniref:hypothetical protein n=1 Tax=Pseudonocardia sp. T1-2H TaxID=3128899 RepID=UPI003100FA55
MPKIDIDSDTDAKLTFASAVAGVSKTEIIARLVAQATPKMFATPPPSGGSSPESAPDGHVYVYGDYEGHRTRGTFNLTTHRVDVMDGPLSGKSFKTPSAAASAVVASLNPAVSPNRNGWGFWRIESSGEILQTIR